MNLQVKLRKEEDQDVLEFMINEGYKVWLNQESSQQDLKVVFCKLLEYIINHKDDTLLLELKCEKAYDNNLFVDVCKEYIKELNTEIEKVRNKLSI